MVLKPGVYLWSVAVFLVAGRGIVFCAVRFVQNADRAVRTSHEVAGVSGEY